MDQSEERELYRRISQLENDITEIKEIVRQLSQGAVEPTRPDEPAAPAGRARPTPAAPPPPRPAPERPAEPGRTPHLLKPVQGSPASPAWEIPEHMRKGEFWLKIIGIGDIFLAALIFAGAVRAAGDATSPMFINVLSIWAIRIPLAWAVMKYTGLDYTGVWLVMGLSQMLQGFALYVLFRLNRWKKIDLIRGE